jgi:hypothetical protein
MKKLILAGLALVLTVLAGCANMPGEVVGTSATPSAFNHEFHPDGPWPKQRRLIDD